MITEKLCNESWVFPTGEKNFFHDELMISARNEFSFFWVSPDKIRNCQWKNLGFFLFHILSQIMRDFSDHMFTTSFVKPQFFSKNYNFEPHNTFTARHQQLYSWKKVHWRLTIKYFILDHIFINLWKNNKTNIKNFTFTFSLICFLPFHSMLIKCINLHVLCYNVMLVKSTQCNIKNYNMSDIYRILS